MNSPPLQDTDSRKATEPVELAFPGHFPPGCPPTTATQTNAEVFRFVWTDPPTNADFRSKFEETNPCGKVICNHCSLSVFGSLTTAEARLRELNRKYPGRGYHRYIAKGFLNLEHGKILLTNKITDHSEFWVYTDVDLLPNFAVVRELELGT